MVQLTQDPHVLGRIDAAGALGNMSSPSAIQALRQALSKETFWGVQCEIARALGATKSTQGLDALLDGLRTIEHPKVRRVLYEALGGFPSPRVLQEVRSRHDSEKSYLVEAEAVRTLGRMKDPSLLGLFQRVS